MSDAVATIPAAKTGVDAITQGAGFYSSLSLKTRQDQMKFLQAINNAASLNDAATDAGKDGVALKIVDVVLQEVQIANEQTGVIEDGIRTTVILEDGTAYYATSKGIAQSLKQAFNVLGAPTEWDEPLEVSAVREKGRNGFFFLTLKF
jgi:hypothetical protein